MRGTVSTVALFGVLLSVVVFATALGIAAFQLAVADVHSGLQRQAAAVAASIDPAAGPADTPELPPPGTPATELGLYGLDGLRIAGSGPRSLAANHGAAEQGMLVDSVPVGSAETKTGSVRIAAPRNAAIGAAVPWWLGIAGAALVCVAIGWGAAALIARRVARPLAGAADAARSLGAGDLAARAPLSGITEVDAVASELNRSSAALADVLERERALAAVASHQLRTPLAAARARLERALLDPAADPAAEIGHSLRDLDDLSDTIDEVIALHRGAPRGEVLDVDAFQRRVSEKWAGTFAQRGRPLRMNVDVELPPVVAGRAALHQITDVLLDNALLHGRGATFMTIRPVRESLAIDVQDEGRFDRDVAESYLDGTTADRRIGLGLATRVATENGFRVVLTSSHPTTMTVLIPGQP